MKTLDAFGVACLVLVLMVLYVAVLAPSYMFVWCWNHPNELAVTLALVFVVMFMAGTLMSMWPI